MDLWRASEHEPLTARPWDPASVERSIADIVADAEQAVRAWRWPGHPLDDLREDEVICGLYLGVAGMVWGLHQLGSTLDCASAMAAALAHYRADPDFGSEAHAPSLWMGETGLLVVAAKVGAPCADSPRLRELVHANREHETWELMWGSPGTILAAAACGLEDEWRDSAGVLYENWNPADDQWPYHLYGKRNPYLGPAHGFAGNVRALRGFVADDVLAERVTRVLTRLAERRGGLANWPTLDAPFAELADQVRVQWCHGAPGLVAALGELMPIELAAAGGELTWQAGPLHKGPGLCHGTAGNGYAFLRLYALTGDPRWLRRARSFAMHAAEQVTAQRTLTGRGRYTLWTGDLGVALYLRACIQGVADFPTIDYF